LGNNLRLLMRGEASLDEWKSTYVGADGEAFDIDKLLPVPPVSVVGRYCNHDPLCRPGECPNLTTPLSG
jgi:hypothetical protein